MVLIPTFTCPKEPCLPLRINQFINLTIANLEEIVAHITSDHSRYPSKKKVAKPQISVANADIYITR